MHPVQIAVLIALVAGTIAYVGYRIRRDLRAEREFCRKLVEELSRVLLPKGFRRIERWDSSRPRRHTLPTFEGPVYTLEDFWDSREREVILLERNPQQPRSSHQIASASLPVWANPGAFAKATAAIVGAAARSNGAVFMKPARFEVRDVFEIANRRRVLYGTILAGKFGVGDRVWAEHMPGISFTISDVGFFDNVASNESWVTLVSEDAPPLTELRQVLPPGSILTDAEPAATGEPYPIESANSG